MSNIGTLYLVPNLLGAVAPEHVLPEYVCATVRHLEHWAVETPKPARAFLKSLNMARAIADLSIRTLPEKNNHAELDALLAICQAGNDLGVLSDAGCPGIADPGAFLVARAHQHSIPVRPLVGPSSIVLALMAAGMNGQRFAFHGYLPVAENDRADALRRLEHDSRKNDRATQIFIETPYRNAALLKTAVQTLRDATLLCVAVDLTLPSESVISQPVRLWRQRDFAAYQKRPAIFLLQSA
jgi:Predicted methyltransferases